MERLISVRLRIGDPVAQTLCVGFVLLGHIREYLPAQCMLDGPLLLAIDDETDRKHVKHSLERHLLLLHLLIYRKRSLRADLQLILDTLVGKSLLERLDELCHELLTVSLRAFQLVGYRPVLLRLRMSEIDLLHLSLYVVKAELVGERNI